jgi:DNA polymerase I-like protein with 3'-5' exonuclease and polymerase domains
MTRLNFPDLSDAKRIAIDLETFDPAIAEGNGTGALKGGWIAGVSIATDTGFQEYYPVAHSADNVPKEQVYAWLKEQLGRAHQEKVGANLIYDLEYLAVAGIPVAGRCLDVQIAEPLLDENQYSYALEVIAQKYLGEGKVENELKHWILGHVKGATEKKWKSHIHLAPGSVARAYALGDTDLPLKIIEKQLVELQNQNLLELFYMESDLIPMLLAMKLRGVRVDLKKANEVYNELSTRVAKNQAILGPDVNVNAAASLARVWDRNGLTYPLTEKTKKPSFTKESLAATHHPVARLVESIRKDTKLRDTFVQNAILDQHINGRIHCQFNQLKSDDKGTVSGRFSSSSPNLQQVPSRGEGTELIRQIFVPEPGEEWYSIDFSQIEYRVFAHYSGDQALIDAYQHPDTDFHDQVGKMLGGTLDRKIVKQANFLALYGGGPIKLAHGLRTSMNEQTVNALVEQLGDLADPVKFQWRMNYEKKNNPLFVPDVYDLAGYRALEVYNTKFPAAKNLAEKCASTAKNRGHIFTLLNRRRRFGKGDSTHKALNALCQGSAADIMKKAMVDTWKSGVCDVIGVPLLTVHDENCFSVPRTKEGEEAIWEAKRIMENAIKLEVPVLTDIEVGQDWGHVDLAKRNFV